MNDRLTRQVTDHALQPNPGLSGNHTRESCGCDEPAGDRGEFCRCDCHYCTEHTPEDDPLDVTYVYGQERELRALHITIVRGGPTIVMTVHPDRTGYVQGFWGKDFHHVTMGDEERISAIYDHLEQHHPFR